MISEKQYLSCDDVAAWINVDPKRLPAWVRLGRFPQPLRFSGRVVRWRREDVQKWLESVRGASA
jgi:predicted DNA-binding transcriptional regulator AlpA